MKIEENISIKDIHTFHLPVKTKWLAEYETIEELKQLLRSDLLKQNPFFHIGGGSNLLFLHDYPGVLLHSCIRFFRIVKETDTQVYLQVGAGVKWDDCVVYAVDNGWGGMENLSWIPGEVGASAVQNIGAYGAEAKDVIAEVETLEIATGDVRIFTTEECEYGYRDRIFKQSLKGKYIVTSVTFRLDKSPVFRLDYGNLRSALPQGEAVTLQAVRDTVIAVRRSKLPEPEELGSAGSFFMNPVIPVEKYDALKLHYPDMPCYPVDESRVKVPAGWLIDRCGWKGKSFGGAAVYERQCLVLVNRGNAEPMDIVTLSEQIRASVEETYGIPIYPEVNFIG